MKSMDSCGIFIVSLKKTMQTCVLGTIRFFFLVWLRLEKRQKKSKRRKRKRKREREREKGKGNKIK